MKLRYQKVFKKYYLVVVNDGRIFLIKIAIHRCIRNIGGGVCSLLLAKANKHQCFVNIFVHP